MIVWRKRRVLAVAIFFLAFHHLFTGSSVEPKPTLPRATTRPPTEPPRLIVAISSFERKDSIIAKSLASVLSVLDPSIPIHVWGYLPPTYESNSRIHRHNRTITSPHHVALDSLPDSRLPHWVDNGQSHRDILDDTQRVRWRSRIVLDAWAVLTEANKLYPTSFILWLENDVVLKTDFNSILEYPEDDNFLSCYLPSRRRHDVYRGDGAVCLVFGPNYDTSILLGYHMVEPMDWILLRGAKQPVLAFGGSIHPRGHKTTRLGG